MLKRLREMHERGQLAGAEDSFRRMLAEAPQHPFAMMGLGHCARLRGDIAEANLAFRAAYEAHPDNREAALEYGTALREAGDFANADAVLGRFPDHYESCMARGVTARHAGDAPAALAHFEGALALAPDRHQPLTEMATVLRDHFRFEEALAVAERLRGPAEGRALLAERSIATTLRQAGRHAEALEAWRRAAALAPEDHGLLSEMATEHQSLGQPLPARDLVDRVLTADPGNVPALRMGGPLHLALGDREGALPLMERLVQAAPKDLDARLRLSRLYLDLGQDDDSAALLARSEADFGSAPRLLAARIDRLREDGLWREGHAAVVAARAAYPRDFRLWSLAFDLALFIAPVEEVGALLDEAPAVKPRELGRVLLNRLRLAERDERFDDALAHGDAALGLDQTGAPGLEDVLRLRLLRLDTVAARAHLRHHATRRTAGRRLIGKSPNASQSFFGQMWNEFALDAEALDELVAIQSDSAEDKAAGFAAAAHRRPHHIPSSMLTMLALREQGLLRGPPGPDHQTVPRAAGPIPRRIGRYWDAVEPPPDLMALHQGWIDYNPGYEMRLFNHGTALDYLKTHFPAPVALAYARSPEVAQRADIFRLAFLWREGGVWVDMDDRATGPIDRLIPADAEGFFWQEMWGTLGNNILGFAAGHPVVRWALETAVIATNRGDRDLLWFSTGPGLMTRAFVRHLPEGVEARAAYLARMPVMTRWELYQSVSLHVRTAYKRSKRHWTDNAYGGPIRAAARTASSQTAAPDEENGPMTEQNAQMHLA